MPADLRAERRRADSRHALVPAGTRLREFSRNESRVERDTGGERGQNVPRTPSRKDDARRVGAVRAHIFERLLLPMPPRIAI